jgi:hypothetical protein
MRSHPRTSVVVVEVDLNQRVPGYESWWDVPIAEVSEMESVKAAHAALRGVQAKRTVLFLSKARHREAEEKQKTKSRFLAPLEMKALARMVRPWVSFLRVLCASVVKSFFGRPVQK